MKPVAHESEHNMRTNVPIQKQRIETKTQPPDIQRRINAGWLKLWRAVYPNTPPPTKSKVLKSKVQSQGANLECRTKGEVQASRFLVPQPSALRRWITSRGSCASGSLLALLATGCASPRPLKGGKAVTTRKPDGVIEQTLVQGENPSQPTKQTQETVKVRTYTVPAGSRIDQSQTPAASPAQHSTFNTQPSTSLSPQPSTLNSSTLNHLHPQRSNARGRARRNPRPEPNWAPHRKTRPASWAPSFPASRASSGWALACSYSAWHRWFIRPSRWSSAA